MRQWDAIGIARRLVEVEPDGGPLQQFHRVAVHAADTELGTLQIGQDAGHFDRVTEIGVAIGALLAAMRLHRKDVSAVEQCLIGGGIVIEDPIDEFILT